MAFLGPLIGSVLAPAIGSLFKNSSASSAAVGVAETQYENETNLDEITTLAERRKVSRQNSAFNMSTMHDTEEAKESNLLQNFYVTVADADKKVIEKLVQSVSS